MIQRDIVKKNGSIWQFPAEATVTLPFLNSPTLFIPITLIVQKENHELFYKNFYTKVLKMTVPSLFFFPFYLYYN